MSAYPPEPPREERKDPPPSAGEVQPSLPFADTPEMARNLRNEYRAARAEIVTPFKAQAVAYILCDIILTFVGASISSPWIAGAGAVSLYGNFNNLLFTGGNLPRLLQAYAIMRGREIYAARWGKEKDGALSYPSFLHKDVFDAALKKARTGLPTKDDITEEGVHKPSASLLHSLFMFKVAGALFVIGGATGEGFKPLLDFFEGNGRFISSERIITGAVNAASIGYGLFFALGNYVLRTDVKTKHERRELKIDPKPNFTLPPTKAAWAALRQPGKFKYKWHFFRHHVNLEHIGSNTLLAASACLFTGGVALAVGGMMYGRPEMVRAGFLMCLAAGVSAVGDYCARLGENRSLAEVHKEVRLRTRARLTRMRRIRKTFVARPLRHIARRWKKRMDKSGPDRQP